MFLQGNALLASEVNGSIDNGITLGDCNAADDFITTLAGGVQLNVLGSLNYKNVNAASFNMISNTSSLFITQNSALNIFQNLNGIGATFFDNNSTLGQSPNAGLLMSTNQLGTLNVVTLPSC